MRSCLHRGIGWKQRLSLGSLWCYFKAQTSELLFCRIKRPAEAHLNRRQTNGLLLRWIDSGAVSSPIVQSSVYLLVISVERFAEITRRRCQRNCLFFRRIDWTVAIALIAPSRRICSATGEIRLGDHSGRNARNANPPTFDFKVFR
jgi:hypothetical protein